MRRSTISHSRSFSPPRSFGHPPCLGMSLSADHCVEYVTHDLENQKCAYDWADSL